MSSSAVAADLAADLDTASLNVLLHELSTGLSPEITALLADDSLHNEILKYLDNVSSIESREYLSSIPPAPSDDSSVVERTLVQDIAELDATQRQLDLNLKGLITTFHDSIIKNKTQLTVADQLFRDKFINESRDLWRAFNEDKLENLDQEEDTHLRELEVDLQDDEKTTDSFHSTISKINQLGKINTNQNLSTVLENINQIINILELPSLTSACIKAGYYSEALETASYTRRLAIRFPNSDLIKESELGIRNEMTYMLTGLIRLLTTNLKQSSIIKTMSYLRRIPPFSQVGDSDSQLRTILLHARYLFIKSELDSLSPLKDNDQHEKYLKRSIEVIREHCFGSVMTYKNIFPDEDEVDIGEVDVELVQVKVDKSEEFKEPGPTGSKENEKAETGSEEPDATFEEPNGTSSAEPSNSEPEEPLVTPASERQTSNLLLFEFVHTVLEYLVSILLYSLPKIKETSTRDGLYLQLIYCAQSLARIDKNFGDLMTVQLLNSKAGENEFLIERKTWRSLLNKQKKMAQSFNK